jgi:hypothetical protein
MIFFVDIFCHFVIKKGRKQHGKGTFEKIPKKVPHFKEVRFLWFTNM